MLYNSYHFWGSYKIFDFKTQKLKKKQNFLKKSTKGRKVPIFLLDFTQPLNVDQTLTLFEKKKTKKTALIITLHTACNLMYGLIE